MLGLQLIIVTQCCAEHITSKYMDLYIITFVKLYRKARIGSKYRYIEIDYSQDGQIKDSIIRGCQGIR